MKNKWSKAKKYIKEEVRPETYTNVMFITAFSFGVGSLTAVSMWFALLLVFPFILGVLFSTLSNQIVKLNTMFDESKKRIDLIREYNQIIDEIIKVAKSDAA